MWNKEHEVNVNCELFQMLYLTLNTLIYIIYSRLKYFETKVVIKLN